MSDTSKQVAASWELFFHEASQQFYIDAGPVQINFKRTSDAGAEQMPAIARLIAAAPELRDALREARKVLAVAIRANWEGATDEDIASHLTIKQIDSALSKAGG